MNHPKPKTEQLARPCGLAKNPNHGRGRVGYKEDVNEGEWGEGAKQECG
jgi:hypothetical protein